MQEEVTQKTVTFCIQAYNGRPVVTKGSEVVNGQILDRKSVV